MSRKAPCIQLSPTEKKQLETCVNSGITQQRLITRYNIILFAEKGLTNKEIAKKLDIEVSMVSRWRTRFSQRRIDGLYDEKGRGHPFVYDMNTRLLVIEEVCKPPENSTHWSLRDLEVHLKENFGVKMDHSTICRLLKPLDIKPHQFKMWLNSNDPNFEAKKVDIIGLYLNPPENAMVISVDEKTGMQALGKKNKNKSLMIGSCEKTDFEYKRNGTQCLFASLVVHKGEVLGKCYDRHRNIEFIDFLETIKNQYYKENLEFHIIVDNFSSHKHENVKQWIENNPKFKFHFTPTHGSWLNQIELWFSILSRKVLKRGIFNSKEELVQKIMDYIIFYNENAKSFQWTYTGKPLSI